MSISTKKNQALVEAGDLVQLVSPTNKVIILRLQVDAQYQTHRGVIHHNELIGKPWGSRVFTHLGSEYILLQPGLGDILRFNAILKLCIQKISALF